MLDFQNPTNRSGAAHTNTANVPDLRKFVKAVLAYTGAKRVDIVAHGMGVTLAREWVRQDDSAGRVRRFVAIEGPNRGMITCSADPANPWQSPGAGAYPGSPVCAELGSPNTMFLKRLNRTDKQIDNDRTLVIRNLDGSCLFILPEAWVAEASAACRRWIPLASRPTSRPVLAYPAPTIWACGTSRLGTSGVSPRMSASPIHPPRGRPPSGF
jgi:pimeloyl-ACP methyl ester carboxylesterase